MVCGANGECDLTITVDDGATGEIFIESCPCCSRQEIKATLGRDSRLDIITLDIASTLFERHKEVVFDQPGGHCTLNGVFVTTGEEQCANYTKVKHLAENCTSSQNFRGVACGSSHVLFNGHIYVAHGAQDTVALQENHNILLSDKAKIETQPQLEIYADRVKCNHGATIGREDPMALFYLQQRGIGSRAAQALLLEGFCHSALTIEGFEQDIQTQINDKLTAKLQSL